MTYLGPKLISGFYSRPVQIMSDPNNRTSLYYISDITRVKSIVRIYFSEDLIFNVTVSNNSQGRIVEY